MITTYIANFDILGYKDAILNTPGEEFKFRLDHVLRDIEFSLSLDATVGDDRGFIVADESRYITNFHYISDTIIFWPRSNSVEDVKNWFLVCCKFTRKMFVHNMPSRGCLYFGEFYELSIMRRQDDRVKKAVATMSGHALVLSHLKAENQSWGATVVDDSVVQAFRFNSDLDHLLDERCTEEMVPYKLVPTKQKKEKVIRFIQDEEHSDNAFEFYKSWIEDVFAHDNRNVDNPRVKQILDNTIELLRRQLETRIVL